MDMEKLLERMDTMEKNMTDRISERMEQNLQKGLEKIELVIASHDKRLSTLEKKITELECSASFTNDLIEEQKKIISSLVTSDKHLSKTATQYESAISQLKHDLNSQRVSSNQLAQYHRSSLNVIIGNVPLDDDKTPETELTNVIVCTIAKNADITNFLPESIDVAHRLPSRKGIPSIIVRFKSKGARNNFFSQKYKLKSKTAAQLLSIDQVSLNTKTRQQRASAKIAETEEKGKIYITESLTSMNGDLLRQAKERAKQLNYKFYGYTVNGEVRVKKTETSKFIPIRQSSDLENIV